MKQRLFKDDSESLRNQLYNTFLWNFLNTQNALLFCDSLDISFFQMILYEVNFKNVTCEVFKIFRTLSLKVFSQFCKTDRITDLSGSWNTSWLTEAHLFEREMKQQLFQRTQWPTIKVFDWFKKILSYIVIDWNISFFRMISRSEFKRTKLVRFSNLLRFDMNN
jgi:hypothetical protein